MLRQCIDSFRIYQHAAKQLSEGDDLPQIITMCQGTENKENALTHYVASIVFQFRMILGIETAFDGRCFPLLYTACARSKISKNAQSKYHRSSLCNSSAICRHEEK